MSQILPNVPSMMDDWELSPTELDEFKANSEKIEKENKEREAVSLKEQAEYKAEQQHNSADKYTSLPTPGGNMFKVVEWIESTMRYPNRTIAILVAEHLVAVFGGGVYHLQKNTTTRKRTLLGQPGLGKNAVTKNIAQIVGALSEINSGGVPYLINAEDYIGSDSFSFSIQHKQIEEHRVRSFLVNEAGEGGKSRAGDLGTLHAYQLQALSTKADETLYPKKYSEQAGSEKVNQMKPVRGAVWVYFHESTIESYTDVLQQSNAFGNGDISRTDLVFGDPYIDLDNVNKNTASRPPEFIVKFFTALASVMTEPSGTPPIESTFQWQAQEWKEIVYSDIDAKLDEFERGIILERNKASIEDDIKRIAMLVRKHEKLMGDILLYATADAVSEDGVMSIPVATKAHLDYAIKRAEVIEKTVAYHARSGGHLSDDKFEATMEQIIETFKGLIATQNIPTFKEKKFKCGRYETTGAGQGELQWKVNATCFQKMIQNKAFRKLIQTSYSENPKQARNEVMSYMEDLEIVSRVMEKKGVGEDGEALWRPTRNPEWWLCNKVFGAVPKRFEGKI